MKGTTILDEKVIWRLVVRHARETERLLRGMAPVAAESAPGRRRPAGTVSRTYAAGHGCQLAKRPNAIWKQGRTWLPRSTMDWDWIWDGWTWTQARGRLCGGLLSSLQRDVCSRSSGCIRSRWYKTAELRQLTDNS